jgi:hypothetical protein
MKDKREVKNLESSVNYDAEALVPSVGKGRQGGIQVCYEAKNSLLEREGVEQEEKMSKSW